MKKRTTLAAVGAAVAVGAGGGAATYAALDSGSSKQAATQVTVTSARPAATQTPLSISDIYKNTSKGVVEITVSSASQASPFGGGAPTQQSQGSGFVYDGNGDIVTNQHVVAGAQSVSVRFWNGATYKATVVGSDPSTDLAVIKVNAPGSLLQPIALGDSSKLVVGDGVVAIGSPFGLQETVTSGIVSALHRQMTSPNNFAIDDSIQTDAAINHGNSGGPLLNGTGQVIGVNAQIESDSGGSDGVGFAIPSNTVRSIASQLISTGKAEHAYLGVSIETIPDSASSQLGLPAGAEVDQVKAGTPAAQAGLKASTGTKAVNGQTYPTGGDVITAIDGKTIASADELRSVIGGKRPGDRVTLTYTRAGQSHTASVTLTTRSS
ncbi:MAG: hypothetical protein QOE36_1515 [Gaiellaceae bacterium]|jgi:putative serine protease PepD|nr:hypothetical protein [Gaiellaceae bacterium]